MVDPIDLRLRKNRVDRLIQLFRGFQVVTEGLLDDDPLPSASGTGDAGCAKPFHDDGEESRRGGEVEDAVAVRASLTIQALEFRRQPPIRFRVVERHPHVAQTLGDALPDRAVDWLSPGETTHSVRHVRAEFLL